MYSILPHSLLLFFARTCMRVVFNETFTLFSTMVAFAVRGYPVLYYSLPIL